MKEQLKKKLNKMTKEQLVEIIESLCVSKDTERMLQLLLSPTQKKIDRLLQRFSRCAEAYTCNSCSAGYRGRMIDSMESIYVLLKQTDSRLSAYTIYEVYQIVMENDLFGDDCGDFIFGLLDDLRTILEHDAELFSDEERTRYLSIIDE